MSDEKEITKSFPKLLKALGFDRLKQHQKGIIPWEKGKVYVEVYKDNTSMNRYDYAWAVGGPMKDCGSFPGGWAYWSPEELLKEFKEKIL